MAVEVFKGFDGVSIVGETFGRPEDPAVVMLPAGGQTRTVWRDAAAALANVGRYAVCLDLRGHGYRIQAHPRIS